MKIKFNEDNEQLYCIECKEHIFVGSRYIEIVEDYLGEKIPKTYHECNCAPVDPEEDLYIPEE